MLSVVAAQVVEWAVLANSAVWAVVVASASFAAWVAHKAPCWLWMSMSMSNQIRPMFRFAMSYATRAC